LHFVNFFSLPLFLFFDLAFYCLFSFFLFNFFITLCFPLLFCSCFVPVFFVHVVSSLAYPNLPENKRLGCCCWWWSNCGASSSKLMYVLYALYLNNTTLIIGKLLSLSSAVPFLFWGQI
jgi:hypothetical protein